MKASNARRFEDGLLGDRVTRLFGTNGVRGLVGSTMNPAFASQLAAAYASTLSPGDEVCIGRDNRESGPALQEACTRALLDAGIHVRDLGIVPSPCLQHWVANHESAGGIIVTASHNPPQYNGIKLVAGDGTEAERALEQLVEDAFYAGAKPRAKTGRLTREEGAVESYLDAVANAVDGACIRGAGLRVVVDPGGGAACVTATPLMARLGVEVVPIMNQLDPTFSGRPSEPSPESAGQCAAAIRAHKAHAGFMQDGDADRCVFLDEHGSFVGGDQAMALVARAEIRRTQNPIVATPVATGSVVADVVAQEGGHVEWTAVGSPLVARRMMELGAGFGGEANGGFIFARHQLCRDGLLAAAVMLELVARDGPLSGQIAALPQYAVVKQTVPVSDERKASVLARAAKHLQGTGELDNRDGLKVTFDDGWVLLRASGTEPLIRVQGESRDPAVVERRVGDLCDLVRAWAT